MLSRRTTAARLALGVMVVLSVLGMHSLMTSAPSVGAPAAAPSAAGAAHHPADHHPAAASATHAESEPAPCTDCNGHGLHSLAHLCLAVLIGAVALLAARLLHAAHPIERPSRPTWVTLAVADGRAPPWTRPTLAQLSVLRV